MKKTLFFVSILVAFVLLSAASTVNAAKPSDYGLKEGELISAIFSDDPDVYIINENGYKRLFLNPEIFKFYGHLGGFFNVRLVTPEVRDSFITSGLFRNCENNDQKVYGVDIDGEDTGQLHWVNSSGEQAVKDDPNFFKKVFCINSKEFNWYPKGHILNTVKDVPQYERMEIKEAISTEKKLESNIPLKEEGKVVICHYPPEAPNKFQEMTIDASLLKEHLAHGDSVGTCPGTIPTPKPTCLSRPACLDATPRCLLSEPPGGWCPIQTGIAVPAPTPLYTSVPAPSSDSIDKFASCLFNNGLVLYGVSSCPYCQKQKDLFGSSFQYVKYVECSSNAQLCQEKGIVAYPTWVLTGGNKLSGVQDLVTLSKYSGCNFLASTPVPTPTVIPVSITVVSPNGGEVFQKGTTRLIKWNSTNVSKIYIKLRKGNDTYPGSEGMITDVIPNAGGYFMWTIPATLPDGNDYSVRVIDGNFTGVFDDSDTPFSIVTTATQTSVPSAISITSPLPAVKSLKVISPNGGEIWYMGKTYDILWTSSGVEKVYIAAKVFKDGASVGSLGIASSIDNVSAASGRYSWTPNSRHLLEGNQIKIEVSNTEIPASGISTPETLPSDESDSYFSIVEIPVQ